MHRQKNYRKFFSVGRIKVISIFVNCLKKKSNCRIKFTYQDFMEPKY